MKKLLAILLSALMLVTLLAACGTEEPSGESAAPASEAPESETPAEPVELTVWHDNDEALMQAMADAANAKLEGTGVTLSSSTEGTRLTAPTCTFGRTTASVPSWQWTFLNRSLTSLMRVCLLTTYR